MPDNRLDRSSAQLAVVATVEAAIFELLEVAGAELLGCLLPIVR